ncbi:DUF4145 domain-containing protein [Neobacillus endophyticus]|uniref:DUF4145 domain-containing protein n=1 Tax=Neobacillus endophyticus TaxID=2738405 RepID=UPI001FE89B9C|nr:DUF4145 domain-containing protein [Neobacillus endophyticus]
MDKYFYQFLEPISKELALVAMELEKSIYSSPRTMLTHARVFVENILQQVILKEKLPEEGRANLKERLDLLNDQGYLTPEIRDALHYVRQIGNQAAHDARPFRFSEALLSWEALYKIVKWYVEVYGPVDVTVPGYQDPAPKTEQKYNMTEIEVRLKSLEELLRNPNSKLEESTASKETAATVTYPSKVQEIPGFTTIRTITYKSQKLEVPYFLRDAFLLPQRFDKSETFLIRLGAEQQARIISELPNSLEGLHRHVKRYSVKNDEQFFEELKVFIEEEKIRRKLIIERPGELFFFFKTDHIVVTEELAKLPITIEEFTGFPSLIRQLNNDEMYSIGQLPKELVILAKYENVGTGTVEKLFEQLKKKAAERNKDNQRLDPAEENLGYKKWDTLYIHVKLGESKTIIRGESVPALWKEGLRWIEAHKLPLHQFVKRGVILDSTDAGTRYALSLKPLHQDNKNFRQKQTYISIVTGETYYLETKMNPKSGLEILGSLLTQLGVEVKIPLLEEKV